MSLNEELFKAVKEGNAAKVKKLLRRGANVNARNKLGNTPLHSAASSGHADIVELLIERGVDVNVKGRNNKTPLHSAAFCGHVDVVKLLLRKGANPYARDNGNKTALDIARERRHSKVAKVIEEFIRMRNELFESVKSGEAAKRAQSWRSSRSKHMGCPWESCTVEENTRRLVA